MKCAPRHVVARGAAAMPPSPSPPSGTPESPASKLVPAVLTALCVMTPLLPTESDGYVGTSVVLAVAWLVGLVVWGVACRVPNGPPNRLDRRDWIWIGLLICVGVSTWWGVHTGNPRFAWNDFARWVMVLTMPFLCRQILAQPPLQRFLVAVMVLLATTFSVHGFYQVLWSLPRMRLAYEHDPDATLRELRIDAPVGSALREHFENRLRSPEPISSFALTNSLAGFLLPWWVISASLVIRGSRAGVGRNLQVVLCLVVTVISVCLWLTHSRTAYVAAFMAVVMRVIGTAVSFRSRPQPVRWGPIVAAIVGMVVFAGGVGSLLPAAAWQSARHSLGYRIEYWRATAEMIRDNPWWGCGPGQFQDTYTRYKLPQSSEAIADPHNLVLEVAAVLGIPALVCFFILAIGMILPSSPPNRDGRDPLLSEGLHSASLRWVVGGVVAGFATASLLGSIVGFYPDLALMVIGLLVSLGSFTSLKDWIQRGELPRSTVWLAASALVLHLLGAGGISFAGMSVGLAILWGTLGRRGVPASGKLPAGCVLVCTALLILVTLTAYVPLVNIRWLLAEGDQWVERAREAGPNAMVNLDKARDSYERAAARDPQSAMPWMRLASLAHAVWLPLPAGEDSSRWHATFDTACRRAVELQPRSAVAYRQLGVLHLAAYRSTGQAELLQTASEFLERGRGLHPRFAPLLAEQAWVAHLAGDDSTARRGAQQALTWDRVNSHAELSLARHKLPDPGPTNHVRLGQKPGPQGRATDDWMRMLAE